jgi:hypothetical protein
MNIGCYLITEGKCEATTIPDNLLVDLCKSLRTNGTETVHFADRSVLVEGLYIPAKGSKNSLVIVPNEE